MISTEEVKKLAALARIDIPEDQLESVRHDIQSILAYVDGINEAGAKLKKSEEEMRASGEGRVASQSEGEGDSDSDSARDRRRISDIHIVKSVLREDTDAHESGIHKEDMLSAAPDREGDYVKVKKILSYEN